jgi:hypothetical protein
MLASLSKILPLCASGVTGELSFQRSRPNTRDTANWTGLGCIPNHAHAHANAHPPARGFRSGLQAPRQGQATCIFRWSLLSDTLIVIIAPVIVRRRQFRGGGIAGLCKV